jgi:chromate transporter
MDQPSLRPCPQSLTDLFVTFTLLALQGFGGVLAVVQRELVERKRWLTQEEFLEEWAVAQIMPGPNVVNLSMMIGSRYFGWRGALAALGGMLALPLVLILLLALLHGQIATDARVAGALRGMAAVSSGLIGATGLKMLSALRNNVLALPLSIALAMMSFVLVALLRAPLPAVLLSIGPLACLFAYRKLR